MRPMMPPPAGMRGPMGPRGPRGFLTEDEKQNRPRRIPTPPATHRWQTERADKKRAPRDRPKRNSDFHRSARCTHRSFPKADTGLLSYR